MKWLLLFVTIFLLLLTALAIFAFFYSKHYNYRFFPGVKINRQSLTNLNQGQAINLLQQQADEFLQKGVTYLYNNDAVTISLLLPAAQDPEVSQRLINFKIAETVDSAYRAGRHKDYFKNFKEQIRAIFVGLNFPLQYEFYQERFLDILQNHLNKYATKKTDARPKIDKDLNVEILAESAGINFNYSAILEETLDRLNRLSLEPIVINLVSEEPTVKKEEITPEIMTTLKNFLVTNTPIILSYKKLEWPVNNQIFKDWLTFKKTDGKISLGLDASSTVAYLNAEIAPKIYLPTLDAKFSINNGKVAEFQGSQDGQELNIEKSLAKIEEQLFIENNRNIDLAVDETKAKVTTAKVNDLGITEIIGTGQSNYAGSPKNRRHNIAVGAAMLDGLLIKPGEEFSLIKALGKVNAEAGYKPELVIKGDRTIPEYGGGLCQIGTTVFRAALASGLPVTERQPHSYRVVYYEPAGKDATIYDPRPDLKFINDTANHILIQTRLVGDDLYFDFWGASDGRIIKESESVIYNIKGSGPTQYIETDELAPGQENCIEKAHNGADAYFDYKVTYPGGEIKETRFTSHYIPWPKKCLIGKEVKNETEIATSTEEIAE